MEEAIEHKKTADYQKGFSDGFAAGHRQAMVMLTSYEQLQTNPKPIVLQNPTLNIQC